MIQGIFPNQGMLDFLDSEGSVCQRSKARKSRRTIADATEEYSDLGSMRVVVIATPPPPAGTLSLLPYENNRCKDFGNRNTPQVWILLSNRGPSPGCGACADPLISRGSL